MRCPIGSDTLRRDCPRLPCHASPGRKGTIMLAGLSILQLAHTGISLVAIATGIPVILALLKSRISGFTAIFWLLTVLTTLTGFMVFAGFTPAFFTGIFAAIVFLPGLYALYGRNLAGPWRRIYAISAVISLYLNCFVLVVQSFLKIPPLHALAPTGSEPPFAIAQGVVLVLFIILGILAFRRFRPA